MRLNMLDPCLPLEYPVTVYVDVFEGRQAAEYEELASLAERGEWEAVLRYVEDHHNLINTSRLRRRPTGGQEGEEEEQGESKTFLWTVLHWAASSETAGERIVVRFTVDCHHLTRQQSHHQTPSLRSSQVAQDRVGRDCSRYCGEEGSSS